MFPHRHGGGSDAGLGIGPYRFKPATISETLMNDYAEKCAGRAHRAASQRQRLMLSSSSVRASTQLAPDGRSSSFQKAPGFQIIHQEFRGLERGMPVAGRDADKDDALTRCEASDAMHDSQA